jgi:epoxyqueuosine reductase
MGDWIFGCDVCQEVCPVNTKAPAKARPEFSSSHGIGPSPELLPLLTLTQPEFSARFAGTPIKRAKRSGLLRNVCVALGNIGDPVAIPALGAALAGDPAPLVRSHAAWALGRWHTAEARRLLDVARQRESEALVLVEIETALAR